MVKQYLLIETRSAWESQEVDRFVAMALLLLQAGHEVALFLIQNGVLNARRETASRLCLVEPRERMTIWADDRSLQERGIGPEELAASVHLASINRLIDLLTRKGCTPVWH